MLSPSNNRQIKLDNISSHDKTISSYYDFKIHNPIISEVNMMKLSFLVISNMHVKY